MTVVTVSSDIYGDCDAVAIEVTADELMLHMPYTPPVGTRFKVRFRSPLDVINDIIAYAEVTVVGGHWMQGVGDRRLVRLRVDAFADAMAEAAAPA